MATLIYAVQIEYPYEGASTRSLHRTLDGAVKALRVIAAEQDHWSKGVADAPVELVSDDGSVARWVLQADTYDKYVVTARELQP